MKKLVDHNANRPNIVFNGIYVLLEGLRRHIERTAHIVFFFFKDVSKFQIRYECFFANPKSAIMALPSLRKIFANLRSLCR